MIVGEPPEWKTPFAVDGGNAVPGSELNDDATVAVDPRHGARLAVWALLGVVALAVLGWGVIKVVDALEAEADCGSYGYSGTPSYGGYGGYGCEPNRSDASLVVEPSTGLVDRQTVTLRGANFDPNTQWGAAQCDAKLSAEIQSAAGCDLSNIASNRTAPDGTITATMRVRRIILVQGSEVDCAVEGACVIGSATLVNGIEPLEAASAAIMFDPSVPAVPRLTVDVVVDRVTTRGVFGTVACNREAEFYANAFVRQTRGGEETIASGYTEDAFTCGPTPTAWAAALFDASGRLRSGPATYEVYGYAYDGFDSISETVSGETRVTGSERPPFEPGEQPGETVTLSIRGSSGRDADQSIDLLVTCGRAVDEGYASVLVSQWVGRDRIQGYGSLEFGPCDGATFVSVPISASNGILGGGGADVRASVYISDLAPSGEFFSDSALAKDTVRLRGRNHPEFPITPNPNSRITIDSVTRTQVSGTVVCTEPVDVSLYTEARQTRGRTITSAFGDGEIDCNGSTDFTLELDTDLRSGDATVAVYGTAYRETPAEPFPIREYLWNDQQAAEVRVRN